VHLIKGFAFANRLSDSIPHGDNDFAMKDERGSIRQSKRFWRNVA